ncbi:MAG TPA: MBOAT family O-acyltransferase [Bacteroidales bacterium]|nr:MBOAT family O-acyltransferase [Bacteroidales bacterium]
MRPLRSFLLLLIFLICFTGFHYFLPASQFFPPVREFIPAGLLTSLFPGETDTITGGNPLIDTLSIPYGTPLLKPDSLSGSHLTNDPLRRFMDSLDYSDRQVRVMYYGDSQLEGDRITSYLRSILRKYDPGTGPGLFLPLMPVMYTSSIWIKSSSNWKRYNYLSYEEGRISHNRLGPFMTICRYLPEDRETQEPVKATVRIRPSYVADSSAVIFDVLRIFYGNTKGRVSVKVSGDGDILLSDTLKRGEGFNELSCNLYRAGDVTIEFTGRISPDIYGLSIESRKGLVIDNIPQRGSAGLEFTMVDSSNLGKALRTLSPDLIIMQYGLNIVKNIRNSYSYYERGLKRQITLLKEICPSAGIIVAGLTDMAEREGDSIQSYPNIPLIINAQRKAALSEGVVFWDAYKAMGGQSSIVRWSERSPPLAQKDYIHLTYQGADTLSKIMAESLFLPQEKDTSVRVKPPVAPDTVVTQEQYTVPVPEENEKKAGICRVLLSYFSRYDQNRPMIFTTPAFWLFFLFVLAGYSIVFKKKFLRNVYLFLISLFFYYKSGGLFLSLLILVTLTDYICGLLIYGSQKRLARRFFVFISIITNLGLLAYFKYTGFFINTVNGLLGTSFKAYDFLAAFSNAHLGTSFNVENILLPVGISFFTFQSLSYIFDVYRKKVEPVRNIIDFGFYVSFFPQLVAGPIVRASEFIPQLYEDFHLSKREFGHALFLISKGLIKKIIISDFIAINFIDRVFDAPSVYSGFENLMAIYGYGLQIYCDFSGYTDIAIGLGLILGFRLPVNFNSPYKSSSVSEFWKRWHISLSRWLKDYLYIPLGGNRKGKLRTHFNLMMTMLLGGLWHGADIRFIIWGGLHGAGLVVNKIWQSIFRGKGKGSFLLKMLSVFITFQFVNFAWVFFRARDMTSVRIMFRQITESFSPGSYMTVIPAYSSVFILILAGYAIHFLPEKIKESYRGLFINMPLLFQLAVIMIVAVMLYQMRTISVMPFIYFRF